MLYDVIVSGLGPGGATAAYELASKGLNVLAFDKEKFPRYKPCGGCLSLKVERALPFDFKGVVEDTIYGVVFTFKSKKHLPIISGKPVGYNVTRDRFDNLLKEKATGAGAIIREGEKVTGIEECEGYVTVKTSRGEYKAKVVIGADGANSIIGREVLGFNPKMCAVAVEAELPLGEEKIEPLRGRLIMDFGCIPHGYAWIFPKNNNISVGIAGHTDKVKGRIKRYFQNFVKREKALAGLDIRDVHGWSIPYFYDEKKKVAKGRVLAVGDAAHLVDPFLGEGIYYAIRSGQLAAKVVSERIHSARIDISAYNDVIEKEFYPALNAAYKMGNLVYNYPRLWYTILRGAPHMMERYYNVIRGEESYENFYAELVAKIKAKPWKLAVRWLKGVLATRG